MNRKKIVSIVLLIAILAAAGAGAFTFFTARAQVGKENTIAWRGGPPFGGGRMGKLPGFEMNGEALAQALGIRVEELQAAQEKAQQAAIQKAIEEGLITQKQAEWFQSKERGFPFGFRLFAWLSQNGIDMDALLAEALGISVEQLNQARQKAAEIALDQAVANGKLTQEQADLIKARRALFANENFINAMRAAFEEAVKKAVQEGVITQTQADLILQHFQSQRGMPAMPPAFGEHPLGVPPFGHGEGGPVPPVQTP